MNRSATAAISLIAMPLLTFAGALEPGAIGVATARGGQDVSYVTIFRK